MNINISDKTNPFPKYGCLHSILSFPSQYVIDRRVDIWVPENYNPRKQYAVLYMHDGQNLFNPSVGFHGQIWAVDQALQPLIDQEVVKDTIVVGIWNTPLRYQEYLPVPAFYQLSDDLQQLIRREHNNPGLKPMSDPYLQFIVEELKPFIDSHYPTYTTAADTAIMGSSMGGLISAYAIALYPNIFGSAACVSTHWPLSLHLNENSLSMPFIDWLSNHLPKPGQHKIYFDFGTETIDAAYEPHQKVMDEKMQKLGYIHERNWITIKDKGAPHSESAWKQRVHIPLQFLLSNLSEE